MPLPPRRGSLITGTTTTGSGGGSGSSVFINVKDHGAAGNGTTDDTAAINATITYAHGLPSGGGRIYFPAGTYKITVGATGGIIIPASPGFSNLVFYGDGDATKIQLSGTPTAGFGVFDIKASNVAFEDFVLDGGQVTSIGLDWSTIADPMQSNLTQGSSFWVRGGCSNIRWRNVTVQHTWGYTILLDATSGGDIDNWEVASCLFQNNRAHTFGTGGVNVYQSWTSGIHYQGDGTSNCVKNGLIHDCRFRRSPGTQIWGHLYAFNRMNSNILVDNCTFTDFGLEGVEHGGLDGGGVTNCHFRRGGFVTGNSDLTAATPAWLSGHACTAIDTTGLTTNLVYSNNTIINQNGGYIDLDGFGQGTVDGNTCVISQSGDPLYTEDSVASFGPGGAGALYCYGINVSNTSGQTLGAAYNTIGDNLLSNIGGGAIRLYAGRHNNVTGNTIFHPPSAFLSPPISMGPVAAGANYRANGNKITNNVIDWAPSSMQPLIKEDPVITAFTGSDHNWVFGNQWTDGTNVFEFLKDVNSGSASRVVLSSVTAALTSSSETWIQREGTLAGQLTRWYKNVNGTPVAIMTLQDKGTYGTAPTTPGPLLNVTNGSGTGGVITTGSRTTLAYDDAVASGKGYFDSHLALTDTTRVQADEDILSATTGLVTNVALMRYRPSVGYIEKSTSISAGVRVWSPLASATPAGSDTQVQFNGPQGTGGSFAASANFTYSTSAKALTVTGTTGTAGIVVLTSYVQAAEGFLSLSTNYQSIQTPSGGFLGAGIGIANASGPHGGYVDIAPLSSGSFPVTIAPLGAFGANDALLWVSAANGTSSPVTSTQLQTNIAINSAVGFVTGNGLVNSIQAPSGGISGKWLVASDSLFFLEEAAPALSAVGQSRIYMDATSHTLKVSMHNGAYVPLVSTGSVAGSDKWVQFNNSAAFGASANFQWNNSAQSLVITGISGTAALTVSSGGYISSYDGFTTASLSYQSIQTPGGGFYGAGLGVTNASGVGGYIDIPPLSYGGSFPYPVALLGASFAPNHVLLFSSAVNGTGLSTNPAPLTTVGLCTNAFINAAAGFSTGGSADNIIQAPNGGVSGKRVIATLDIVHVGVATGSAPTGASGQGKLYYDTTLGKWMVLQGTASAVPMLGSASPGGSDTYVQFNGPQGTGGSFTGVNKFTWSTSAQALTITGLTGTSGLNVLTSHVSADEGFVTTSLSYQSIQSPGGGLYAASAGITNGGGVGGYIDIPPLSYGGSFPYPVALLGASFASNHVLLFTSAVNGTGLSGNPAAVTTVGLCTNAFINAASGFSTAGTADNIIQAPSGGVTGKRVIATFDIVHTGITGTAPTGAAGQGKLYFDNITGSPTQGKWMVIQGTASAVQMIGGSGSPGGADTNVQFNGPQGTGGSFSGSANFVWSNSLQRLTVFGVSNTAGLAVGTGYIQSDGGYLVTSTNTAWNTVQTSGGVRIGGALQVGGSYTADQSAAANGFLVNTMGVNTSAGVVTDVWDTSNGNQFIPALLIGRRASGTGTPGGAFSFIGTPTGTFLFSIGARGSVSGGFAGSACATINFVSAENQSSSNQGGEIQFAVVPNGSTIRTTRMWMRNSGVVEMQGQSTTTTSPNPGCILNTGYFQASDGISGGYYANSNQSTAFNAPFGGATLGLGITTNQALYPKTLGTGTSPNNPASGYGGLGHRSGSTYWYYNGSTWASVDFAASGGGGGVTSLNGLTGGITLFWVGGITIGSGAITFGSTGLALTAGSNSFTGTSNSFNNAVTFAASSSTPITIGSGGMFFNGIKTINSNGIITGNGILLQNGVGALGFNVYLSAGSGIWTYAGGATLNILGADGHTYNFQGGALVGKDGSYVNLFNVTPP